MTRNHASIPRQLECHFDGEVLVNRPLAPLTTFRVGGVADVFCMAESLSDVKIALSEGMEFEIPVFVLGRGSNILVSDEGFRGIVVKLGRGFAKTIQEGLMIEVGAAVSLPVLAREVLAKGLGGLEFAIGIPGSVGGGMRMNAGAHGGCLGDRVHAVTTLMPSADGPFLDRLARDELSFSYRHSSIDESAVILAIELRLHEEDEKAIRRRMERFFRKRKRSQPIQYPNAGSVFRNPSGLSAGKIIDQLGLKGRRVGDACVSEIHANFIVNLGGATAQQIHQLMSEIEDIVRNETGIVLEREIKLLGEF